MTNYSVSALARRFAPLLLASMLMAGCASKSPLMSERLDERTGVTITALDLPVTLAREAPDLAYSSRDYAFVGPVEFNRMGQRSYYLWIGMASTVDRSRTREAPPAPVALSILAAGVPLVVELEKWDDGRGQTLYQTNLPVYATYRAAVSLDIIKLLANADTLRIGLEGAAESWHYSTWSGTSQEWLALADWESTLPENREAYTRRR